MVCPARPLLLECLFVFLSTRLNNTTSSLLSNIIKVQTHHSSFLSMFSLFNFQPFTNQTDPIQEWDFFQTIQGIFQCDHNFPYQATENFFHHKTGRTSTSQQTQPLGTGYGFPIPHWITLARRRPRPAPPWIPLQPSRCSIVVGGREAQFLTRRRLGRWSRLLLCRPSSCSCCGCCCRDSVTKRRRLLPAGARGSHCRRHVTHCVSDGQLRTASGQVLQRRHALRDQSPARVLRQTALLTVTHCIPASQIRTASS